MSCNCENCSARREGRSTITYRTYASGGVVKAELADTTFDAVSLICRLVEKADMKTMGLDGVYENVLLDSSYRGKARANMAEGDVFNEEIGKDMAKGRALEKYHRAMDKKVCAALQDARRLVATIEHYCEKKSIDISEVPTVEDIKRSHFTGHYTHK